MKERLKGFMLGALVALLGAFVGLNAPSAQAQNGFHAATVAAVGQSATASWVTANFVRKGPVVAADATANNIVGTSALGKVPLNVQQRTGAGVDAFKVYANGGYRFQIDSNGSMLLTGAVKWRSDSVTGTTTPGYDMSSAVGASRTILRVATATATADRMIQLPAANNVGIGQMFVFYDATGEAATKNITINRRGSDTINGTTAKTITTAYGGAIFITDSATSYAAFSIPGL